METGVYAIPGMMIAEADGLMMRPTGCGFSCGFCEMRDVIRYCCDLRMGGPGKTAIVTWTMLWFAVLLR